MKLFLMAGSETTAATIPVLFYLLVTHKNVQVEWHAVINVRVEQLTYIITCQCRKLTCTCSHTAKQVYNCHNITLCNIRLCTDDCARSIHETKTDMCMYTSTSYNMCTSLESSLYQDIS